jgi:hypothetical protein
LPMFYMWDDHDYGTNDSGGDNPSRAASLAAFRRRAPVQPADPQAGRAVYYSFIRGRVRFIVTDLRSDASPRSAPHDSQKTRLGTVQKAWFKAEILAARATGEAVCWVNTLPWAAAALAVPSASADAWSNYHTERTELAAFINDAGMAGRLFAISGDMHALAFVSSQRNTWGGWPICHAAPLDRAASHKLAPSAFEIGPVPATTGATVSQYGVVEVEDAGGATLSVTFRGMVVAGSGVETEAFMTRFDLALGAAGQPGAPEPGAGDVALSEAGPAFVIDARSAPARFALTETATHFLIEEA